MSFLLLSLVAAWPAAADGVLGAERVDPFVRPAGVEVSQAQARVAKPKASAPSVTLRGVLVDGDASLANFSGTIVAVGDQVAGHRLVKVTERSAWLERNGQRYQFDVQE